MVDLAACTATANRSAGGSNDRMQGRPFRSEDSYDLAPMGQSTPFNGDASRLAPSTILPSTPFAVTPMGTPLVRSITQIASHLDSKPGDVEIVSPRIQCQLSINCQNENDGRNGSALALHQVLTLCSWSLLD